MASIEENNEYWGNQYDWKDDGHEWSNSWGTAEIQWFGSIYLRIMNYLPTGSILEIAPGNGRWTKFLQNYCRKLYAVDVSHKSIAYCKNKFKEKDNLFFFLNNGTDLSMIQDSSIDFVFSFDSFVHFDYLTVSCYVSEMSKKLKPEGFGFIHHSNLKEYPNLFENDGWRSPDMNSALFNEICCKNGLECFVQEQINWGNNHDVLSDCLTLFIKGSQNKSCKIIKNYDFIKESFVLKNIYDVYN